MSTSITNKIIVVNDEGDTSDLSQTTVSSVTIPQTLIPPVSFTYTPSNVLITRKTIDPIIITVLV
jgi:hypothetical protein